MFLKFNSRLKAENICSEDKLPSVSSINRIVRSNKRYDTSSSPLSSSSLNNYNQSYDNEDASYDNGDEDADNYENDTQRSFYTDTATRIKHEKNVRVQFLFNFLSFFLLKLLKIYFNFFKIFTKNILIL